MTTAGNLRQRVLSALPPPVVAGLRRAWRSLRRLNPAREHRKRRQAFDEIYATGVWGRDASGLGTSGSGSHDPAIIEPYVAAVHRLLDRLGGDPVAVDLGCGDFTVGSQLFERCKRYIACDVSEVILRRNRELYRSAKLEFHHVDLAYDELPRGDVAFVRQVLQHLSNDAIRSFVARLARDKPFSHLVVTEHLPEAANFVPNLDINSGPFTRLTQSSGVDLAEPPFRLSYASAEVLCTVPVLDEWGGRIVTTLYKL